MYETGHRLASKLTLYTVVEFLEFAICIL